MTEPRLQRSAARRIACAVVAAELRRQRGTDHPDTAKGDWPGCTSIGGEGLGLDSMEQLGALGALAEAFDLDDSVMSEDPPQTVGAWVDWIMAGHAAGIGRMAVATSGSTGSPRLCVHYVTDLLGEATFLATEFTDRRRVVALIPAHHLYGIIWTALLPDALGVPVVVRAIGAPLGLTTGDLVVAVPEQWQALVRMVRHFPADVIGVSSAGSLDDSVAERLLSAGLIRLVDIYGASETGGIAMRDAPASAYTLLPRWQLSAHGSDDWQLVDHDGRLRDMPDHVERIGDRGLRPLGRRDGAVTVGGHNVWPERVANTLRGVDGVVDVAVRLQANGRLKAFVVPQPDLDPVEVSAQIEQVMIAHLTDPERPKSFRFGSTLPRNAMGKLEDWS